MHSDLKLIEDKLDCILQEYYNECKDHDIYDFFTMIDKIAMESVRKVEE